MNQPDIIQRIIGDSRHSLALYSEDEIAALRKRVTVKTHRGKETPFIKCIVRDKDIQLRPEEVVRQLYAVRLINHYGYPVSRLAVEHPVKHRKWNTKMHKSASFLNLVSLTGSHLIRSLL